MTKSLVIMRGCPGSGKSYAARQLAENSTATIIHSTDDFFYKDGVYRFDPSKLYEYHTRNFANASLSMVDGSASLVIIDNTNITKREFVKYVEVAGRCGYEVQYVEPSSPWWLRVRKDLPIFSDMASIEYASLFVERTVHNVPLLAIARMLRRWENIA